MVIGLGFLPGGDTLASVSSKQIGIWRAPSWAGIEAMEKGQPKAP
jgi:hypothetical protein